MKLTVLKNLEIPSPLVWLFPLPRLEDFGQKLHFAFSFGRCLASHLAQARVILTLSHSFNFPSHNLLQVYEGSHSSRIGLEPLLDISRGKPARKPFPVIHLGKSLKKIPLSKLLKMT